MSKPDSASGSLDSILASIRKSLSEQSTDALSETGDALAEQPQETKPRKTGLTQRLAGAASEEEPAAGKAQAGDDLSDLLEDQVSHATPSTAPAAGPGPAAAPAAASSEDPLWFLARKEEPPVEALPIGPAVVQQADANAKELQSPLTRPEVLRASLPPFFGSTAAVAKTEPPAPESKGAGAGAAQPVSQQAAASFVPAAAGSVRSAGPQVAAVVHDAATPHAQQPVLRNGQAGPAVNPGVDASSAPGVPSGAGGLEAAVLDLLKPMLSQWLDRNMPRLVAEALKDEAVRARPSENDANKA